MITLGPESKVPRLSLVADRENGDDVLIDAISSHITAIAQLNHPLAEFLRQIFDGTADTRLLAKNPDGLQDGFARLEVAS